MVECVSTRRCGGVNSSAARMGDGPMCYSAQIKAEYQRFVRSFGARISIRDFFDIYWRRAREDSNLKVPKDIRDAAQARGELPETFLVQAGALPNRERLCRTTLRACGWPIAVVEARRQCT